jgi:hypothetical protein
MTFSLVANSVFNFFEITSIRNDFDTKKIGIIVGLATIVQAQKTLVTIPTNKHLTTLFFS